MDFGRSNVLFSFRGERDEGVFLFCQIIIGDKRSGRTLETSDF